MRGPIVPDGYTIEAIASDLAIPRQTLALPNGDILIAEGSGGGAPVLRPKDIIANFIKGQGKSSVRGGNRLTLLRDADGDGVYELRGIFADNLNAPYGLALIGNALYVANQDELVRFDYRNGQAEASGPPAHVTDLPSAINHHWTKALTASPDGRFLYVGIGSNSNITERGMDAEIDRAMIWEIDAQTGAHRPYASGLRNPTALTFQPGLDNYGPSSTNATRSGLIWCLIISRPCTKAGSTAGLIPIGGRTSIRAPSLKIPPRSLRQSVQITASDRTLPRSASPSPAARWERSSQTASLSANTAAGIAACRLVTRWCSSRSVMDGPPAIRSTSSLAFLARTVVHAGAQWA